MKFLSSIDELTGRTVEVKLSSETFDDERILECIRVVGKFDTKSGSIVIEHDKSDGAMIWAFGDEGGESDGE